MCVVQKEFSETYTVQVEPAHAGADTRSAAQQHSITVGIDWVQLASAISGFSGYNTKLAYCSSVNQGAPVAQW